MHHSITPQFEALIGASRLDSLNSHPSSVYGLDSGLEISYLNPAWFKFAEENGNKNFSVNEWSLGKPVLDSIPDLLKSFYTELFESALNAKDPSIFSRHLQYECSSSELYRRFSMHLYPLGKDGFVTVHSLLVEEPYLTLPREGLIALDENQYIDINGIVRQCANCRRIQSIKNKERWDWIPKWVNEPVSNTSHGICPPCLHHYYLSKALL